MERRIADRRKGGTPFDNIESAHEYVHLLGEAVEDSLRGTADDLDACTSERQRDALRLVTYKLTQLRNHLAASSRILNDLRTLRRLLLNQRTSSAEADARHVGRGGDERIGR